MKEIIRKEPMTEWKEFEKEILKAIVNYDGKAESLAEVLNKSKLPSIEDIERELR